MCAEQMGSIAPFQNYLSAIGALRQFSGNLKPQGFPEWAATNISGVRYPYELNAGRIATKIAKVLNF